MQLTNLSTLYNDVRLDVPGAPDPLIGDRLRWSATEFCKRTLISNETLNTIDLEAGEPLYRLPTPNACVNIWRVMWVKTSQRFLGVGERQQMAARNWDWDNGDAEWPTMWVPSKQNNVIQLVPKPNTNKPDELTVHCAFIPATDAEAIDSVLVKFFSEGIVTGAISKLLRMAGAAWYDPAAAREREIEFKYELTNAKSNQGKDNSIADMRVAPMPFA